MATKRVLPRPVLLLITLLLAVAMFAPGLPSSAESSMSITLAPATPVAVTKPGYTEAPCPFKLPEGQVEGKTIKCGYLAVPQDRSDPKSPLIRLAVATFRNPAARVEKDPVIVYLGGSGVSGLEMLDMMFADLTAPVFAANRDLVICDQRGSGLSEPALDCPDVLDLNGDLLDMTVKGKKVSDKEAADLGLQAISACAKTLGTQTDLSDFHANAGAADVEDLRKTLGYDKVNLWGIGYGTRLVLEMLRDYPAGVRSAVLDSAVPPEVDPIKEGPANLARSLDLLFKACAADKACNAAYPNLQQIFKDTVSKLNKTPLSFTFGEDDVVLDGDDLVGVLYAGLGEPDLVFLLPRLIDEVGAGDSSELGLRIASFIVSFGMQPFVSHGAAYSFLCHDEITFATPKDVNAAAAKYPELAGYFEYALTGKLAFRLCEAWGAGKGDLADNMPVVSTVPTLVLAGSYDPIAPPAWGQATAKNLKKAYFFEYPGLGDAISMEPCPAEMMAAFLKNPGKAPDAACARKMGQPQWEISPQVKLVPYRQPSMGIEGAVPEGWRETDTGRFVRSTAEFDPTALLVQAAPMTAEDMTAMLAKQLGVIGPLQSTGEFPKFADDKLGILPWKLYAFTVIGGYLDIAICESDGLALLVVLQSLPDERELLFRDVFFSAMDALVPITGPAVDAANQFLAMLKEKDTTAATAMMTAELLKASGGAKKLEAWLKENKVEPASWALAGRDVADDSAQILARLTLSDDSQITLTIDLVPVKGRWLVDGLQVE
jgi:pimeloyl-ACP methyl ester carboxylesterase